MRAWFRRCQHDWQLIDKTMMPSGLEQAHAAGMVIERSCGTSPFEKKLVLSFKCGKCGSLKISEHSNP